jgi:hypothetical protein
MRLFFRIFFIFYSSLLVLTPLNAYAEDKTFTCRPVIFGTPKKNGNFYIEAISDEFTPALDVIPTAQLLLRDKDKSTYFKNNSSRDFEVLIPYEKIADVEEIRQIQEGLSSYDEMLSIGSFKIYYLRYTGGNGLVSLKRISINDKKNKAAVLTIPMEEDYPSYFSLFDCEANNKNTIEVEWSDDPNKRIS